MESKNCYEAEIAMILKDIGIPAHLKGYRNLVYAISLVLEDESFIDLVTKRLYPEVAVKMGVKPSNVERTIRGAIEIAFSNMSPEKSYELFGNCINPNTGKVTNKGFIAQIATTIKLNEKLKKSRKCSGMMR